MGLPHRLRERAARWLVPLLLAAMALQGIASMRLSSATFDEATHLASGYTYLYAGDLRLNPQHPPLVKMLCAAPLLALEPRIELGDPAWTATPPDEWAFGYRFLYGNDADRLLFWGRMPVVLLSLLLASYVHRWARDLFGREAGLVALVLCAFSPTILAHGHLVTFDVALACFSTMALFHLWRHSQGGGRLHLVGAGLGLGLALASKFSGGVLLAAFVPLIAWGASRGGSGASRGGRGLLALGVVLLLAALVVQASYLFSSDPRIYWKGLRLVNADHVEGYSYYLMGEFAPGGWWYYFLAAFVFKTPVPTLVCLVLAAVFLRRFRAPSWFDEGFLVLPALLWVVATSALADNMGVRYLAPVYPLVFVFVSRLARALPGRRWAQGVAAALGLWYVGGTVAAYPDHLAYFNELVGGPSRGHLVLDDSNIDWGQDLKRLGRYLDEHDVGPIRLRYGLNSAPDYYGIDWQPVTDDELAGDPPPGVYALGTDVLIRGELMAREYGWKTDWLRRYEPAARVGFSIWLFELE